MTRLAGLRFVLPIAILLAVSLPSAADADTDSPMSAAGCVNTGQVCIYVNGSGLYVNYVQAAMVEGGPWANAFCYDDVYADVYFNGNLVNYHEFKPFFSCNGAQQVTYRWYVQKTMPPTQICIAWYDATTGVQTQRACETTHA